MRRSIAFGWCVLAVGCLDYSAAYDRCVAAGRCDRMVATGGGGGGGGGAAGGGVAGGAAGGTQPAYDGGPVCSGSTRPRLRCDPPWVLEAGGPYGHAALGALEDGLAAAWSRGQNVELKILTPDGGIRPVLSEQASGVPQKVRVATEGNAWALLYLGMTGAPLRCFSSFDDGGVSVGAVPTDLGAGVSVARDGGVAVVHGGPTLMSAGLTTAGCPTGVIQLDAPAEPDWVDVVHIPGTGREGFRLTSSGQINSGAGNTGIAGLLPDAGFRRQVVGQDYGAPNDHLATLAGANVHFAYRGTKDSANYDLVLRSMPANFATPPPTEVVVAGEPASWSMSTCGAGCLAVAWAPADPPSTVSVLLATDEPVIRPRGVFDAGFDAVCNPPRNATSVAVAWHEGRLRLLLAEPAKLSLYSCDVPPP